MTAIDHLPRHTHERHAAGSATAPVPARRRPVNARSFALGLAGAVVIAALAPYNDFVVGNTALIGGHLPTGVLLIFLVLILLVNAPLHRWRPRLALDSGELAVALGMMLVACSLPSGGLMRYLPGNLTGVLTHAAYDNSIANLLRDLDLPAWIFPATAEPDIGRAGNDPIVRDFAGRVPGVADSFAARWAAVPWAAWARPAVAWGVFTLALLGAVLCLTVVFRRQWVENERLPFPLAQVYLSLIEPPEPGRALNSLFGSRGFWIAAGAVFAVHAVNALHGYDSRHFPEIPIGYDFTTMLGNEPWVYADSWFKHGTVYFTIVGLIFVIQSKVAFSLWFFFLLAQVVRIGMGMQQQVVTKGQEADQCFGASVAFAVAILWVARHHLATVAAQMFRPPRPGEARGRYLPYAAAGWGLVACLAVCVAWLVVAGATLIGSVVIVMMAMLIFLVLARIVAETGIPYVWLEVSLTRPFVYAVGDLPGGGVRTTPRTYFLGSLVHGLYTHDLRETLPGYSMHAMRVADDAAYPQERDWRRAAPLFACLAAAVVVSFVVSGASMLYSEYSYGAVLNRTQASPINIWGANHMPREFVIRRTMDYVPPGAGPQEPHDRLAHFAGGAALGAGLNVMRLRFAWWPLHPLGFVLAYTIGIGFSWFSIFLGWLAKVTVINIGGAGLYRRARGVFTGLIIGEAAAVACWLVVSLVCVTFGWEFRTVQILPT